MPMSFTNPLSLRGSHASLVPLESGHAEALRVAVADGELWRLWYTAVPSPDAMAAEIERRLALREAGSMLPFTVLDRPTQRRSGMTTYMNIDAANRRVEIGSTWYARAVQRSALNTECKLMLLAMPSRRSIASRSSSAPTSSTGKAGAASSGSAPSSTASCATTSSAPTAACAIPASTASSRGEWPAVKLNLRWQLDQTRG